MLLSDEGIFNNKRVILKNWAQDFRRINNTDSQIIDVLAMYNSKVMISFSHVYLSL